MQGWTDALYLYSSEDAGVWEKGIVVESSLPDTKIIGYSHRGQEAAFSYQLPQEGDGAVLTMPIYAYPGYHARVDGTEVPVNRGEDGRLQLQVSAPKGEVKVYFRAPWAWNASCVVSLLAFVAAVLLDRKKGRGSYESCKDDIEQHGTLA